MGTVTNKRHSKLFFFVSVYKVHPFNMLIFVSVVDKSHFGLDHASNTNV